VPLVHSVTILSKPDVFLSLEKLHVKKIASQWNKKTNYQTLERGDSISVLKTQWDVPNSNEKERKFSISNNSYGNNRMFRERRITIP